MRDILLRRAELSDLPVLLAFEQGIVQFERPYDPTLADDPISYYDLKAMISAEHVEIVLATVDDRVVGSAYVRIDPANDYLKYKQYGYMGFMFVEPEFRGRGINKMIIDELAIWSKEKGLNELRLDVYADNPGAIRAYEKAGFSSLLINMRKPI